MSTAWLDSLELLSVITEITDDLLACPDWDINEYSHDEGLNARVWRKYPGF